jgi:hypothetical protein
MSSTEIQRPNVLDSKPFWPVGRIRLLIDFEEVNGQFTATGFDPDQSLTTPVFTAPLSVDQEAAFLEAVRVGTAGTEIPASNDNRLPNTGGTANTVVVSDPGPGDKGPRFWEVPLQVAVLAARTARPTGT